MPEKATAQAPLQEIIAKVNRILDIEEKRERRRKWGIVFWFVRLLLYIAIPVGVGYAFIEYFENIFPTLISKITSAMQQSLTSGAPPKIEITEELMQQLKGMMR